MYSPYNVTSSFDDKVVWLAGASSGIGESLAYDLGLAGAKVILSARRVDRLKTIAKNFTDNHYKNKPSIIPLDILNYTNQEEAFKQIIDEYGHIDYVVMNAGRSMRSTAIDFPLESTREIFELNFFSYVKLTKLVLPKLVERKQGHLVVVSSVSGIVPTPLGSSYSATKFALVHVYTHCYYYYY